MKKKVLAVTCVMVFAMTAFSNSSAQAADKTLSEIKEEMRALYGENKPITDGN